MDKDLPGPMTPFDELVTTPELQLMKLLIPYAPVARRKMLAALVKYMELREAVRLFGYGNHGIQAQAFPEDRPSSPIDMLNRFRPYLNPQQISMLDTIINIQEMMSVMDMMRASQSDTDGQDSDSGSLFDPMELISGMLTPEQRDMFQAYSDMFSQPQESVKKGDAINEQRMDEQSGNEEYRTGEAGTDSDGGRTDFG
nr:hypothetical protein [uncultured Mediterraneibacter sp.]